MEELLLYIAKSLVKNLDEVSVENAGGTNGMTNLKLTVEKSDMGRVIGRQGRIARSIRVLMKSAAIKFDTKVNVEIVDVV